VRHPALTPASAIALTLSAVGGLTTVEIANAFLVPEATMAQRISRAKQTIRASNVPFELPVDARTERISAVMHVLYLIFNEGYATTQGPAPQRDDLAQEAIRLTRMLRSLLPDVPEVRGLLALMILTRRASCGALRAGRRDHPARRAGSIPMGSRRHRAGRGARE
jgi:predicted RNA polymerase sigma factor